MSALSPRMCRRVSCYVGKKWSRIICTFLISCYDYERCFALGNWGRVNLNAKRERVGCPVANPERCDQGNRLGLVCSLGHLSVMRYHSTEGHFLLKIRFLRTVFRITQLLLGHPFISKRTNAAATTVRKLGSSHTSWWHLKIAEWCFLSRFSLQDEKSIGYSNPSGDVRSHHRWRYGTISSYTIWSPLAERVVELIPTVFIICAYLRDMLLLSCFQTLTPSSVKANLIFSIPSPFLRLRFRNVWSSARAVAVSYFFISGTPCPLLARAAPLMPFSPVHFP